MATGDRWSWRSRRPRRRQQNLAEAQRDLVDLVAVDLGDHVTYRLYPVADHMADKVCATMDTNYPGGKRSSRVKDLVDLVVLAHAQAVVLDELRNAIATKRVISGIEPFAHFGIPDGWTRTYPPRRRASRRPRPSRQRPDLRVCHLTPLPVRK